MPRTAPGARRTPKGRLPALFPLAAPTRECARRGAARAAAIPHTAPGTRPTARGRSTVLLLLAALALACVWPATARAADADADASRAAIRAGLRRTVAELAALGPRHRGAPDAYAAAAALIRERLAASGLAFEALANPAAPGAGPVIATLPAPGPVCAAQAAAPGTGPLAAPAGPTERASTPAAPARGTKSPTPHAAPLTTAPGAAAPIAPLRAADTPGAPSVLAAVPAARPRPLVLVAHYDTVPGSPGALDNASGVAVLLEVARLVAPNPPPGLRIVFAPEEEQPHFMTPASGSVFYAALLAARGVAPGDAVAVDSPGLAASARAAWDPAHGAAGGTPRITPGAAPGALAVGARPTSRALAEALAAALAPFAPVRPVVAASGAPWVERSDHAAFAAHGWRAALLTSPNVALAPCMHRPCDLPGGVDFTILENTVQGIMRHVFRAQGGRQ